MVIGGNGENDYQNNVCNTEFILLATPINRVIAQSGADRIVKNRMDMFKKIKAAWTLSTLTPILKIMGQLFNSQMRFVIGR